MLPGRLALQTDEDCPAVRCILSCKAFLSMCNFMHIQPMRAGASVSASVSASSVRAKPGRPETSSLRPTFLPLPPSNSLPTFQQTPRKCHLEKRRPPSLSSGRFPERPAKHRPQQPVSGDDRLSSLSRRHTSHENGISSDSCNAGTVYFMAIANEFSMASLYRRLLRERIECGSISVSATGSILHLAKHTGKPTAIAEAFVFAYGCLVVWGSQDDADDFLAHTVEDALELRAVPAVDTMEFVHGDAPLLHRDVITLQSSTINEGDRLDPGLERLAISCGLAQSIKLGAFESAMRKTIENTRHLPEELARSGKITASRQEVAKLMGQLFLDRYRYHLSGDLLMTPAFFWENEQYLPSYRRVERYLEVRARGEVLNKRVEVVQELYKLLGEEVNQRNSVALELAITVMIAFEILLTLLTLARESMRSMFSACAIFVVLSATAWAMWLLYRRLRLSRLLRRRSRRQAAFLRD